MPNRFKSLLEILAQADVQFILIGGVAANLHGSARATFDIDIVYARSRKNFAAITSAGKLKAKYVIHAASMGLGSLTTADTLRTSTQHSLRLASERGLKTIAFPAVGTGIAGFPMKDCAEIMLQQAAEHLRNGSSLETIYFVLFDEQAAGVFERTWKRLQA